MLDEGDFNLLAKNLGLHLDRQISYTDGDINFDGRIDLRDWLLLRGLFAAQGRAARAPEPTTAVLGTWAIVAALLHSRGRFAKPGLLSS